MTKSQANATPHPEADIMLFENFKHFSSILSSRNDGAYSEQ